jgi:sugar phosphate permease
MTADRRQRVVLREISDALAVPLIIADITASSGRYNLAKGAVGMVTGIGAALSTTAIGYLAQWFGFTAGLLVLAAVAACGFVFMFLLLKESRPAEDE